MAPPNARHLSRRNGPAFKMKPHCKLNSKDSRDIPCLCFCPLLGYSLGISNEAVRFQEEYKRRSVPMLLHPLPLGQNFKPSSMTSLDAWPWGRDLVCLSMSFSFYKMQLMVTNFPECVGDWRICVWLLAPPLDPSIESGDDTLTYPLGFNDKWVETALHVPCTKLVSSKYLNWTELNRT